jgi:hypothetical protein
VTASIACKRAELPLNLVSSSGFRISRDQTVEHCKDRAPQSQPKVEAMSGTLDRRCRVRCLNFQQDAHQTGDRYDDQRERNSKVRIGE